MARLLGETAWGTDHELVRAVRLGEDSAFEELFSRYRSRIRAYVSGMLADFDRAEDITQEVFISALRRLRDTERPIAFKPWIYQIAKNACIDELRRAKRNIEVPFEEETPDAGATVDLFSREPDPELAAESKQQLDDLRRAFGGVSELHHRILVLREFEGLSYGRDRRAPGDDAPGRREHPVPRPPPAGRGVRRADQRTPLRAHTRSDRRAPESSSAAARRPRPPPVDAAPRAMSVVPAPRIAGADHRAGAAEDRGGLAGRRVGLATRPRVVLNGRLARPCGWDPEIAHPVGYWIHSGRGAAW